MQRQHRALAETRQRQPFGGKIKPRQFGIQKCFDARRGRRHAVAHFMRIDA